MTLPTNTPAGRQAEDWLHAVNSGCLEAILSFTSGQYAPATLAERDAHTRALRGVRLYDSTNGLDPARVVASTESRAEALLRTRVGGDWWRLTVEVEPDAPHRVTSLVLRPVPEPAEEAAVSGEDGAIARLDAYLDDLAGADVFSGAVLLARGGCPIYERACGFASQAFNAANRTDTRFNLGSMNKMFTAVAVCRLVETGRLRFESTVGEAIPAYPNRDVAKHVTIHHLLTHTGGLGNFFTEAFDAASRDRFRKVRDFDRLYVDAPLRFRPGQHFHYSNAGFMLLGRIIEAVTGEDYYEHIRATLTRPAGMVSTESLEMDIDVPNRAVGYTNLDFRGRYHPGPKRTNTFMHIVRGTPAGGGFSTVGDMMRFDAALRAGTVLGRGFVDAMWTPHVDTDADGRLRHGYGMFLETVNGQRIAGHSGVFAGLNSQLDMYLDSGYTAVVMANYDPPLARRVCARIREWLTRV